MKASILGLFVLLVSAQWAFAQQESVNPSAANIIGTTAILLNRITLLAVVGGNEVTNPFMVTEVYVQQDGNWKLAAMSFTRLLTRPGE